MDLDSERLLEEFTKVYARKKGKQKRIRKALELTRLQYVVLRARMVIKKLSEIGE
jgi:hypothetical protein